MKYSYSRVDCFKNCPMQFKYRYLDKLKTLENYESDNALILGTTLHHAIEGDVEKAIEEYYNYFPSIDDTHINQSIKIEVLAPKVKAMLSDCGKFETAIEDAEKFIGYIDYLDIENGILLDFKYSNNKEKYAESGQIHVYRYFLKKLYNIEVKRTGYLMIPKLAIRQKKDETVQTFRNRLYQELDKVEPEIIWVDYDPDKVEEFFKTEGQIETATDFEKIEKLCKWCDYYEYCTKGEDYMIKLPSSERRDLTKASHKKIWMFGLPYSGKTTLANEFPKPLMINTDGNINFVDAPYITLRDSSHVEGKLVKNDYGWIDFKDVITTLETEKNDFETIILDLMDDLYESCRKYVLEKNKLEHESDGGFGKGWDLVRSEFLIVMKRFTTLPYNIVLISHEDNSGAVTKKNGESITTIRPVTPIKVANKISGMVDITIRTFVDDDKYMLSLSSDEMTFGGGRLKVTKNIVPNSYESIENLYKDNLEPSKVEEVSQTEDSAPVEEVKVEEVKVEEPTRRTRRSRAN